eukprot:scaffold502_cov115-Isochrysis_galbana.AAC.7
MKLGVSPPAASPAFGRAGTCVRASLGLPRACSRELGGNNDNARHTEGCRGIIKFPCRIRLLAGRASNT